MAPEDLTTREILERFEDLGKEQARLTVETKHLAQAVATLTKEMAHLRAATQKPTVWGFTLEQILLTALCLSMILGPQGVRELISAWIAKH